MREKETKQTASPLWTKALDRYRQELGEEELNEYESILEAGTLEELVDQIKTLEPINVQEKATVNRLDPILKFVNDFSAIIALCFGADAKLAAIVWGSIRLILRLASETTDALQDIVDILEELSLTLPRFRQYEKTLPIDASFENALINIYTEVICFYARTIHFYRSNPHHLLRCNAWATFQGDFGKTITRIKRLSSTVESEAEIAKMKMERDGYAEVIDLMKTMKESKIASERKSCFHVPFSVNPRFWGRQEALKEVRSALEPDDGPRRQRSFALNGMGGVGKTQIALKYAAESRHVFDTILWISAESTLKSSQSFRDVAQHLALLESEQECEDSMSAMMKVKDWLLDTHQQWLLIFDNADDLDVLRNIWPHHSYGSILITSRKHNIAFDLAEGSLSVEPFDDSQGSEALLRLLKVDSTPQSLKSAKEIAHVLGGLPLALNQISGFISQRKIRLEDFLTLYEKHASKIDARKTGISDYEHTLGTVWELSLDRLAGNSRSLQELLAFFNPDKIDEKVLLEGSQHATGLTADLVFLREDFDVFDAEEALMEAALINKSSDKGQLSIHRLIQAAVLRKLSIADRIKYLDAVILILCWGFPNTFLEDVGHQHQSWEICEMCLPHVDHVVNQKNRYQIRPTNPEAFAELLLRCCWYLYEREIYDTARSWVQEALSNFQDTATLAFASAVELLGLIQMDTNLQKEALASFTQALEIRAKLLAPEDGLIAASLTTLGIVHTELGNLDEAYAYHQRAIDIRLRTNSDRIGNSYSNMSSLLLRMGKPEEAEEMLKRCPSLQNFTDETFLKTRNPRFSGDMILLSRIRDRQSRLEEAVRLATKALQFRQSLLGNRLKTCDALYQVAVLLQKREKIASATELMKECVSISESLPEGQGQLARALYMLFRLYKVQGRERESQEYKEKALSVKGKIQAVGITSTEGVKDDMESYDRLNLWMLW